MAARLRRAVAALALGAVLPAQQDPSAEAVERCAQQAALLLRADEPALVAHGAALAGRVGAADAVPALRRELDRWTRSSHAEADHVRLFLLDALIRLEATLPGEELAPHLGGVHEPLALILLARDPAANAPLLFATLQRHWLAGDAALRTAAGNLLASTKAAGFAAWLLPRLPLRLCVTVRDHDPAAIGVGTGGAGGSYRARATRLPDAWPPVPRHELTTQPTPFAVLLAPGPEPVFWRRTESAARRLVVPGKGSTTIPPGPSALRWLGAMARDEGPGLELFRAELVRWQDAEAYLAAVAGFRAERRAAFDRLVARLVVRGALSAAEAEAVTFPLTVEVVDERRDRTVALPEIAGG